MATELDVVVHGASGFVGRLTAEHLAAHAPAGARIGLSGRSKEKLEAVRRDLGPKASAWPVIVADAADRPALDSLVARTAVVATTVGPYRRFGLPLAEACAASGTHYADLTGEVLFMHDVIDRCHDAAAASGARIVHSCGFDSIPSDLGVWLLHEAAGAPLTEVALVVTGAKGGASGGTIDSLRGQVDEARRDPTAEGVLADPYALSPDRQAEPEPGDGPDPTGPSNDPDLGGWNAPFVMGQVNTRVVRRSNALQGHAYGRSFRYREVVRTGRGIPGRVAALAMSGGLAATQAGLGFGPTRAVLDRVLPSPGEGPSEATRRNGYFRIEVHGRTEDGRRLVVDIDAKGDPGYNATAVMLGEAALCLALDGDRLPERAGVLTPSTAMGEPLLDRLRAAGHTYAVRG